MKIPPGFCDADIRIVLDLMLPACREHSYVEFLRQAANYFLVAFIHI